jgi:hypothetical protein
VSEQTLRQNVSRTRRIISKLLLDQHGALVDEQDIIQSLGWNGYRLNPFLERRALPFVLSAVRSSQEVSRNRRRGVTSLQSRP